jgi:hypothetical protein
MPKPKKSEIGAAKVDPQAEYRAKKDADTHALARDLESRFGFTEGQAYVESIKIIELREINGRHHRAMGGHSELAEILSCQKKGRKQPCASSGFCRCSVL